MKDIQFENIQDYDIEEVQENDDASDVIYYTDREFYDFLISHDALEKYVKDFENSPWHKYDFEEFANKGNRYDFINDAFPWDETDNEELWSNLDNDWVNYLNGHRENENLNIDFEDWDVQEEDKDDEDFHEGDIVMLKKSSKYYYQSSGNEGTVISNQYIPDSYKYHMLHRRKKYWIRVVWNDRYTNEYPVKDLIKV